MGRLAVLVAMLAGCSFTPPGSGATVDGAAAGDGQPQADAPTTSDGAPACMPGFLDLCGAPMPTSSLDVANEQVIDTDNDPRCFEVTQAGGPAVCVIVATTVNISVTGKLSAFGTRALAISATGAITIAGELDVGSYRGGPRGPASQDCAFARTPDDDPGGAGGGAGGTFAAQGGDGGTGDTDSSIGADGTGTAGLPGTPVASPVLALRGGCRGQTGGDQSAAGAQGGVGGAGGGAVYVTSKTSLAITSTGGVRATGAGGAGGGAQAGGGGGGAGGMIVLEAPAITIDGDASANGGGGGEGGANVGGTPVAGLGGADGAYGTAAAPGGEGADNRFGFGGPGGASASADGGDGTMSAAAGGGGGGAAGVIRLFGTKQGSGTISPPAS